MIVLEYNKNGFPFYWFNGETMKVWKRIDKNTSQMVKTPKKFENIVLKFRIDILNSKQQIFSK